MKSLRFLFLSLLFLGCTENPIMTAETTSSSSSSLMTSSTLISSSIALSSQQEISSSTSPNLSSSILDISSSSSRGIIRYSDSVDLANIGPNPFIMQETACSDFNVTFGQVIVAWPTFNCYSTPLNINFEDCEIWYYNHGFNISVGTWNYLEITQSIVYPSYRYTLPYTLNDRTNHVYTANKFDGDTLIEAHYSIDSIGLLMMSSIDTLKSEIVNTERIHKYYENSELKMEVTHVKTTDIATNDTTILRTYNGNTVDEKIEIVIGFHKFVFENDVLTSISGASSPTTRFACAY